MNKYIILGLIICFLLGCNEADLNGVYVGDKDGNVYRLEHRAGPLYYPKKMDSESLNEALKNIKQVRYIEGQNATTN